MKFNPTKARNTLIVSLAAGFLLSCNVQSQRKGGGLAISSREGAPTALTDDDARRAILSTVRQPKRPKNPYAGMLRQSGGDGSGAARFDYLGTWVGAGISGGSNCGLDPGALYNMAGDAEFVAAVCQHSGSTTQFFLASIDYKDASGRCMHGDWTGLYQFDCAVQNVLLGYEPQFLRSVPKSGFDPVLANPDYNAVCFYAVRHHSGTTLDGYWGACGVNTQLGATEPTEEEIQKSTTNPDSTLPSQTTGSYSGALKQATRYGNDGSDAGKFDYLGTWVGPGISGGANCGLDPGALYNLSADPQFVAAVCQHSASTTQFFLASVDYKDSSGRCLHGDWTGLYEFDCALEATLLGYAPKFLRSIPRSGFDPALADPDYNATCFYAVRHHNGTTLDGYWGACGVNTQLGPVDPSADQILRGKR